MRTFFIKTLVYTISLVFITILLLPKELNAQNKRRYNSSDYDYISYQKNEIFIQYGAPTIIELTSNVNSINVPEASKEYKATNSKYTGVGAFGYNYYINPYFSVGGYFGISEADMTIIDLHIDKASLKTHVRAYTGMISANWTYFRKGIWEISSGVSAGVCYKDEKYNAQFDGVSVPVENDRAVFAYNLSACKARIGGTIGGFLEVGFGFKGLVNAGLSIRL